MGAASASVLTVQDSPPLGDVALAPPAMRDPAEVRIARSMADCLLNTAPDTGAEALALLRRSFPHAPLTLRVAALAALMRKSPYIPR